MTKKLAIFLLTAFAVFFIDRYIKGLFLDGFRWYGDYISLILVFNKGVAFSMFAFLQEYLKYIQIGIFVLIGLYLFYEKSIFLRYFLPLGILFGAGVGNIYDRFSYSGVVDYIYWHKWFNFAVFNFADVMIDFAVVWIVFISYRGKNDA